MHTTFAFSFHRFVGRKSRKVEKCGAAAKENSKQEAFLDKIARDA